MYWFLYCSGFWGVDIWRECMERLGRTRYYKACSGVGALHCIGRRWLDRGGDQLDYGRWPSTHLICLMNFFCKYWLVGAAGCGRWGGTSVYCQSRANRNTIGVCTQVNIASSLLGLNTCALYSYLRRIIAKYHLLYQAAM